LAELKDVSKTEIKKYIDKMIADSLEKEISSSLKSKNMESIVKDITSEVLAKFYKSLYMKSSIWIKDLK
jgi:hypothetical protein